MAHYALVNESGVVVQVITGRNEGDFFDGISNWETHYSEVTGYNAVKTSYNTYGGVHYTDGKPSKDQSKALRKNYAGIGYTYDLEHDAFIPPKPYESWVLDEATCLWQAPIEYPGDGGSYVWEESQGDWVEVVNETT
jgi:hypothetical protein